MTHQRNCIDDILDRITQLEKRLDEMEKSFNEHATDYNIHVKHKTYKAPIHRARSPPKPPPPGLTIGLPPKIKRAQSSPSRITFLPMPEEEARPKTPAPVPPPLPSAKETKEEKADKLKF